MKSTLIKALTSATYILMIATNVLANSLPINNRSTGQISYDYPNLFAPAGLTFSIWGLIYLLLAGYVLYQFFFLGQKTRDLINKINPLFIATSLSNISWIFAWHYDYIGFSVLIMALLLFFLIKIADLLRIEQFNSIDRLLIWAPFSVYFGWITVAFIANITVFLVSIRWNGFGISDYIWTSIILVVGALIGIIRMRKDDNIAYGFVLVWAYIGILLKHLSADGFGGQYPNIIITVIICLIVYIFYLTKLFIKK